MTQAEARKELARAEKQFLDHRRELVKKLNALTEKIGTISIREMQLTEELRRVKRDKAMLLIERQPLENKLQHLGASYKQVREGLQYIADGCPPPMSQQRAIDLGFISAEDVWNL